MTIPFYADVPLPADPPECHCMDLGAQVCSVYENWCSDVQTAEWYNALTQAERHELTTAFVSDILDICADDDIIF